MLTKKDYCDYETCVALREMGYDGYCAAYYHLFNNNVDARNSFEYAYGFDFQNSNNIYRVGAPLLYQAQKWLREEKGINISPVYLFTDWGCIIKTPKYGDLIESHSSYEEALLEGIKEAVKILKEELYGNRETN